MKQITSIKMSPQMLLTHNGRGIELDVLGYDEFGISVTSSAPKTSNPFGFTGYGIDNVSSSYSSPSRAYDPKTGRFTSQDTHWNPSNMIWGDPQTYSGVPIPLLGLAPDPLATGQSSNLYGYTMNNPLTYVDLNGEFIVTALAVTAGLALAGASIGGGASVASDIGNGRDINWREAGRNALRGRSRWSYWSHICYWWCHDSSSFASSSNNRIWNNGIFRWVRL